MEKTKPMTTFENLCHLDTISDHTKKQTMQQQSTQDTSRSRDKRRATVVERMKINESEKIHFINPFLDTSKTTAKPVKKTEAPVKEVKNRNDESENVDRDNWAAFLEAPRIRMAQKAQNQTQPHTPIHTPHEQQKKDTVSRKPLSPETETLSNNNTYAGNNNNTGNTDNTDKKKSQQPETQTKKRVFTFNSDSDSDSEVFRQKKYTKKTKTKEKSKDGDQYKKLYVANMSSKADQKKIIQIPDFLSIGVLETKLLE
jgi:hypothetical protein